jgi:hypothetical protein
MSNNGVTMAKTIPTDSKQLIQQRIGTALAESKNSKSEDDIAHLLWLAQGIDIWHRTNGSRGHSLEDAMKYLANSIVRRDYERDQQRLSAALEALPKIVHTLDEVRELNKHLDSRMQQSVIDKSAGFIETIEQCRIALTAALGPDNSNDT